MAGGGNTVSMGMLKFLEDADVFTFVWIRHFRVRWFGSW